MIIFKLLMKVLRFYYFFLYHLFMKEFVLQSSSIYYTLDSRQFLRKMSYQRLSDNW